MLKRPSEERLTLEERVAVVVAIAVAVGVHLAIFLGGSGIGHLAREEQKRERLMVIRQVREITPAPELAVRVPDPRRVQVPAEPAPEGKAGGSPPPKPEQKVSERGTRRRRRRRRSPRRWRRISRRRCPKERGREPDRGKRARRSATTR